MTLAGSGGTVSPRVVVVTRPTELEGLLARHGTREQARFFLEQRGRTLPEIEERHARREHALQVVSAAVPLRWRRSHIDRVDLSRFVFGPEDLVVVVGQDGLVANVAKYLSEQLVLGVNPDRDLYDGVLVPHLPEAVRDLLPAAAAGRCRTEARTMVEARADDGQRLLALNEIFVGHRTHQSARYQIRWGGHDETQSSSGVIVTSGTGATGWARSIARQKSTPPALPAPTERRLAFFVREPFPSHATGTTIDQGLLREGENLTICSEMNELGTVFGDGIEDDRVDLAWGMKLEVGVAPARLNLILGMSPTPPRALILVDLQNDFCPGGALAVPRGDEVVPVANRLAARVDLVVATQDWHPPNHGAFAANHRGKRPYELCLVAGLPQTLWPVHCVQGTAGAALHVGLSDVRIDRVFRRGTDPALDGHSGFFDNGRRAATGLAYYLRERGVNDLLIMGLATDTAVRATALDAASLGFTVTVIEDGCRGVELRLGDVVQAFDEMRRAGVIVMGSGRAIE